MGKFRDLTGMKFGRLTVISRAEDYVSPNGRHRVQWVCRCDCGVEKIVLGEALTSGRTISCGCAHREIASRSNQTHGKTDTRLYGVWCAMKRRCHNSNAPEYARYGGRGISICEEWDKSFETFETWALSTGYDPDAKRGECTLDRIDNNGNYCPANCRWVSQRDQMNNVSYNRLIPHNGETHTLAEWAREYNIPYARLSQRINRYGYSFEESLK